MKRFRGRHCVGLLLALLSGVLSSGCAPGGSSALDGSASQLNVAPALDATFTAPESFAPVSLTSWTRSDQSKKSKSAHKKSKSEPKVIVLMYHRFTTRETRYDRTFANFKKDLNNLYELNFRPVTLTQFLNKDFPIAKGMKPIVFTFDDSTVSQVKFTKSGELAPDCAVSVWEQFAKTHPDFPVHATFFIVPTQMFGQRKWIQKKVRLLRDLGCELGNHTWNHPDLRKISSSDIEQQLGRTNAYLRKFGFDNPPFAYPYGVYPRSKTILTHLVYKGQPIPMPGAVTCDTRPSDLPGSPHFNKLYIPRIEATEPHEGMAYWLRLIRADKLNLYTVQ